ncbi:MAG: hypothetical protein HDR01_06150 [Lachnospiraceae bacterium]|nr:hypothetical protein [Lachnospiraceae bacterium]
MEYIEEDFVRIAKRENNKKRNYLVVNPLQGKHVPVSPSKALEVFERLASMIKDKYIGERLLLIGFAETATAIGAQVAITLGTKYIQTTRELIPGVEYLFFSEEHSHATEQKLVKDDIDKVINHIDRVVFVEDEVTTGNTIMNIIKIIRNEYQNGIRFAVASILNGMTDEYLNEYDREKIDLHYLVKTDHSNYGLVADTFAGDGEYVDANDDVVDEVPIISVGGWMNARRLVDANDYQKACSSLVDEVLNKITLNRDENVLVVGSEEFMYPALFLGSKMEGMGCNVRCHSTTRSPIAVSKEPDYPLHCRYDLYSLYDSDRKTFIYDIYSYDEAIIITDSELSHKKGLETLVKALSGKMKKISVVRWC